MGCYALSALPAAAVALSVSLLSRGRYESIMSQNETLNQVGEVAWVFLLLVSFDCCLN